MWSNIYFLERWLCHRVQKQRLRSGWGQNEIGKLSTLYKICTPPAVKTRIYNVGRLQLFCSSSGSTSRLLPWTYSQTLQQLISKKGGKPKSCVNPAHDQIMSQTTYVVGIFDSYINQYPICPLLSLPSAIVCLFTPLQTHRSISYPETNKVSHPRIFSRSWLVGSNFDLILVPRPSVWSRRSRIRYIACNHYSLCIGH